MVPNPDLDSFESCSIMRGRSRAAEIIGRRCTVAVPNHRARRLDGARNNSLKAFWPAHFIRRGNIDIVGGRMIMSSEASGAGRSVARRAGARTGQSSQQQDLPGPNTLSVQALPQCMTINHLFRPRDTGHSRSWKRRPLAATDTARANPPAASTGQGPSHRARPCSQGSRPHRGCPCTISVWWPGRPPPPPRATGQARPPDAPQGPSPSPVWRS